MSRTLTWLNLSGVAALAILCACQWRANRTLNLDLNTLRQTGLAQAARLAEQDKTLAGLAADLDSFRHQITRAHADIRELTTKLHDTEETAGRLTAERDQLKEALARWTEAVRARDARLAEANDRLRDLGGRLKEAVEKFNDLATRYNDRTRQLNELTTRYNQLIEELNQARGTKPATGEAPAKTS
jgi:chromosome segregation ATPase